MQPAEFEAWWNQIRLSCVAYNPRVLSRYKCHSNEVYGELNPNLVGDCVRELGINSRDTFFDLGSGVGNVVMQVAVQTGCRAVGIEIRSDLHQIATLLLDELGRSLPNHMGSVNVELRQGDCTAADVTHDLHEATVVLVNNFCFPVALDQMILAKLYKLLKEGARMISTRNFGPRFRPSSPRFKHDLCHMFQFPWRTCMTPSDGVSWTGKPIPYFCYRIKRSQRPAGSSPSSQKRRLTARARLSSPSQTRLKKRKIEEEATPSNGQNGAISCDAPEEAESVRLPDFGVYVSVIVPELEDDAQVEAWKTNFSRHYAAFTRNEPQAERSEERQKRKDGGDRHQSCFRRPSSRSRKRQRCSCIVS